MRFLFGKRFSWYEMICIAVVADRVSDTENLWWFAALIPLQIFQTLMDKRLEQ